MPKMLGNYSKCKLPKSKPIRNFKVLKNFNINSIHATDQTDPPYSTGALSTEGLEEHKYRASLFIDTLNNDPIKEMNKTHELVVTASDEVLVR